MRHSIIHAGDAASLRHSITHAGDAASLRHTRRLIFFIGCCCTAGCGTSFAQPDEFVFLEVPMRFLFHIASVCIGYKGNKITISTFQSWKETSESMLKSFVFLRYPFVISPLSLRYPSVIPPLYVPFPIGPEAVVVESRLGGEGERMG